MLSSYKTVKPCQKCLVKPAGVFGVRWAVSGTDFCIYHSSQLPQVAIQYELDYDGDMGNRSIERRLAEESDTVSRKQVIERIETQIEEWRETLEPDDQTTSGRLAYASTFGNINGLKQALEIIKDL